MEQLDVLGDSGGRGRDRAETGRSPSIVTLFNEASTVDELTGVRSRRSNRLGDPSSSSSSTTARPTGRSRRWSVCTTAIRMFDAVRLKRNFGQHPAMHAGIAAHAVTSS